MGQRHPFSKDSDGAWLSSLVDTFERAEALHNAPCDPALLAMVAARLRRPAELRHQAPVRRAEMLDCSI